MKYKSVFIPILLMVMVSSCAKEAVKVPKEVNVDIEQVLPHTIHTDAQKELLDSNDPAQLIEDNISTYGRNSLSKPLPVAFTWNEENDINQNATNYKLTISESDDLSNPLTYVTKDNSVDIYNLKINTNYYYRVSSNHQTVRYRGYCSQKYSC